MSACVAITTDTSQSVVRWENGDDIVSLMEMAKCAMISVGYQECTVMQAMEELVILYNEDAEGVIKSHGGVV